MGPPHALVVAALVLFPLQVASAGTTYSYDALGRVISARQDDGKQAVYVYDAAGNRTQTVVSAATVNRSPVAVPDSVTLFENQSSISIDPTLNDTDPDGTALSLYSVADGRFGAATRNANAITYASTWHRNGVDDVIYTVTDGQGQSASGRLTVTLANLPPVTVADNVQSLVDLGGVFDPLANDADPGHDQLRIISVTTASHGTATTLSDGSGIMYVPVTGFVGADAFSYVVDDGDGGTAVGTVNVNVVATMPPPPSAAPDQITLQTSIGNTNPTSVTCDPRVNDTDPLGGWLRIIAVTQPAGGTVEIIEGGTGLRIATLAAASSADIGPFTYTIQDGLGRTASATVNSTVIRN